MTKVGDYKWSQLSMWDFAPKDSVQWFKPSINTLTGKPWHTHTTICASATKLYQTHTVDGRQLKLAN